MQSQDITVQKLFINETGPCKIIDENGKEWKFWKPGKYGGIDPATFSENESYKIGFVVRPFNGVDEFYIKQVGNGKAPPVSKALYKPAAEPPPRPRINPVEKEINWSMAHTSKSYTIETTAVEMISEINKLRKVWANTFGAAEHNRDAEMNDEIPDSDMDEKPAAFVARYDGCKKVVSHGGYIFPLDVTFDDAPGALEICGGLARPDNPVYLAVARITDESVIRDYESKREKG